MKAPAKGLPLPGALKPMKSELVLKFVFEASHSLAGYETPHPHLWRLEVSFTGQPLEGKVIDIVRAREVILSQVGLIQKTYLNTNPLLDPATQKAPTCETLSLFFWNRITHLVDTQFRSENPTTQLHSVSIAICNMDGEETGLVRLSP